MLEGRSTVVTDPADARSTVIRSRERLMRAQQLVAAQAPLAAPLVAELHDLVLDDVHNLEVLFDGALDDISRLIGQLPSGADEDDDAGGAASGDDEMVAAA